MIKKFRYCEIRYNEICYDETLPGFPLATGEAPDADARHLRFFFLVKKLSDNSKTTRGCTTTHPLVSIVHCPNYLNIHQKKINCLTICAHFPRGLADFFLFDFF